MKTNNFSSRKLSIYSVFGLLALVLTSCGTTYQNKSYYDNDGVYVSETPKKVADADRKDNEKYRDYFSSLNQENQEVFTDVENYTSNDSIANAAENQNRSYSSWGSNSTESIVVNVYDNNWGWNSWNNFWYGPGWGWNNLAWNSWYGPGWGWGWNSWYGPNWGWGWNGFYGNGWGWNGWYGNGWNNGYGNNYAFANGPRGGRTATVNRDSRFNTNRNSANPRSFTTSNTRNNTSGTRATTGSGTRVNTGAPRSNTNSGTRVNTNSTTRPQNNDGGTRVNTTRSNTTTRSYSDTPRSYSPSPSSSGGGRSGGYSGGGGGGGRSGGGGRR